MVYVGKDALVKPAVCSSGCSDLLHTWLSMSDVGIACSVEGRELLVVKLSSQRKETNRSNGRVAVKVNRT